MRLESIGAAVEPERPGLVCFDARGLLRLHGGIEGVLAGGAPALRARRASGSPPRASPRWRRRPGRGPAARRSSPARAGVTVSAAAGAASLPRAAAGRAAARPARAGRSARGARAAGDQHAGRAGGAPAGGAGRSLRAGGPARPRARPRRRQRAQPAAGERVPARVARAARGRVGIQLERGLGLLIDRLLARRERRGRTLRAVVISAVLVEQGGTWREQVVFREALADPVRMRLALAPHLAQMPAPAEVLRLAVERFGPPAAISGGCWMIPRRRGRPGCARRSARPGPPPGPRPRCGCSRSIPTRASPSGGRCWRRSRAESTRITQISVYRLHRICVMTSAVSPADRGGAGIPGAAG